MFEPIGYVKSSINEKIDHNWGTVNSKIIINDELKDGLKGLEDKSNVNS